MKKLVAYITSCYPEKSFSIDLALALGEHGVDSIELGIPFSDPVADGPIIEKAGHKALQNGFKFQDVLDISQEIAKDIDTLWMGYFNPFYQYNIKKLAQKANELHVSGLIIPDLPLEEALSYQNIFNTYNISNISFIAPTDSKTRIKEIVKNAKKFIYMVAYTGITGSKRIENLQPFLDNIKEFTNTPTYVGFGVNAKTAKEKVQGADGVIVGSAFIDILLDNNINYLQKITKCSELASIIKQEINT